mmetsp:Transcript_54102/g.131308  ORF Transcript_54102/g.131308 Transcript_54102/m.131308 type:complete len:104 (-) Transcript_54102:1458-1769(-)
MISQRSYHLLLLKECSCVEMVQSWVQQHKLLAIVPIVCSSLFAEFQALSSNSNESTTVSDHGLMSSLWGIRNRVEAMVGSPIFTDLVKSSSPFMRRAGESSVS